jgi:hypothetical protein
MPLKRIRLELARTHEFPQGSPERGYDFVAPLTPDGHLDSDNWSANAKYCTVRRFWPGEDDQHGHLRRSHGGRWVFHYDGMDEDLDEPIFALDRHTLVEGEYITITEHDGEQLPFKAVRVSTIAPAALKA